MQCLQFHEPTVYLNLQLTFTGAVVFDVARTTLADDAAVQFLSYPRGGLIKSSTKTRTNNNAHYCGRRG